MNKYAVVAAANLIISPFATNSALSDVNPTSERESSVCGFMFAPTKGLKVTVMPISPRALKNRVDNERYEACPYKVTVKYDKVVMQIDFSQEINLESLREADQDGPVRAGYFQYDKNGWRSADENIKIKKDEISTVETPGSVTVSGTLTWENQHAGQRGYCFSVVAISREKYATGAVCREKADQLNNIRNTFRKKPIISAYY